MAAFAHRHILLAIATTAIGMTTAPALAHDPAAVAVLQEVQKHYAAGAVCERVSVQVKQPPAPGTPAALPRVSRASYAIRYRAVPEAGLSPRVGLELGQYIVDATPTKLHIAHVRDATSFYASPISGIINPRTLAQTLPPVPIPQLDLAEAATPVAGAPGGAICTEFWPYAQNIQWTAVEADPRSPSRRTLRGSIQSPGGGVVTVQLAGPRMRVLTIDRAEPRLSITLSFTPLTLCEPDHPQIDVSRRMKVDSLLDLKPRGGSIRVGEDLPQVVLSPAGGGDWSLSDLLDPPAAAAIVGMPPAEHAVLVFTREPMLAPADLSDPARSDPARLSRVDFAKLGTHLRSTRAAAFTPPASVPTAPDANPAEHADQPPRFGYARVLVFSNPDPTAMLQTINATGQQWGMPSVLFSVTPTTSLDMVWPGVDACVLVVDSFRVVKAVIPIDPGMSTEQLADQIAGALFEAGAPRGMAKFVPTK